MGASLTRPAGPDQLARWAITRKILACVIAVAIALLSVPGALAWAASNPVNGSTDGGPGIWRPAKNGGPRPGTQSWDYEQQIKGGDPGLDYWVPLPETRQKPGFDIHTWDPIDAPGATSDGVKFDGYDSATSELIEAKGPTYAWLLDPKNAGWSKSKDGIIQQAQRQLAAASETNTPIRWEFAEADAQRQLSADFARMGVKSVFTPPAKPDLFDAPGSPADPDGNAVQGGAAEEEPGGIDFSTLQLHYLSATTAPDGSVGLKYSFQNTPGLVTGDASSAREASDAFFVWLSLDPSQFWVNLNPHQPDTIIDPALARTDVGKVLLESDLQLKKSITDLMDPNTKLGNEFWQKIYHGPDNDHCFWIRNWIVPQPAAVRPSGTDLYILDAPLEVRSENWHDGSNACPGQTQQRADYNEQVIHDLLLPAVQQKVNTAPEFAELRKVYLSRIAAEWYRQLSTTQNTQYKSVIGSGIVGPWASRTAWDPKDVFNQYVKLVNGTHSVITVDGVTYRIVYGGVDFSKAPQTPVSQQEFQQKWPQLPQTVDRSISKPTLDSSGKSIWFGGTSLVAQVQPGPPSTTPPPPSSTTGPPNSTPPATSTGSGPAPQGSGLANTGVSVLVPTIAGVVLCMMGVALVVLMRRRARNRT
ncbi:Tox-REase-5 domain-containing protein [Kutzneria sp. CA-103260]|uniref:Tox-REase-5 domain-containing protein n=1 Tax=Kutzneria sp. CA-103260 TaxID=2802641 RepID=UPI001BA5C35C|nr:Tox-REase-5 domain-containing protein [Kutzneria sp. CA-103260]QUQ68306.1 Restriction endonuclease fold toxin 5 [Kutzneria sp. CA-103260]